MEFSVVQIIICTFMGKTNAGCHFSSDCSRQWRPLFFILSTFVLFQSDKAKYVYLFRILVGCTLIFNCFFVVMRPAVPGRMILLGLCGK